MCISTVEETGIVVLRKKMIQDSFIHFFMEENTKWQLMIGNGVMVCEVWVWKSAKLLKL